MNRLLIVALLSFAGSTFAKEQDLRECKVLAADEWITMGSTTIAGCVKYAEAAVTVDEPQYAQFGATPLMLKDGQFFRSTDGTKDWQRFQPFNTRQVISTLNSLQPVPKPDEEEDEESPRPGKKKEAVEVESKSETAAAVTQPRGPRASSTSKGSARRAAVTAAAPVPTDGVDTGGSTRSSSVASSRKRSPDGESRACQIQIADDWQTAATPSLARCADMMYLNMNKVGASEARAYWAGTYLVVSHNKIFQSSNGQDWVSFQD